MSAPTTILANRVFDGERFLEGEHVLGFSTDGIHALRSASGAEIARLASAAPGSGTVVDLRGHTLVPGLINTHAHTVRGGAFEADEPPAPVQAIRNFHESLRAGVTTMADMGATAPLMAAVRAHLARHPTAGPSLLAAGPLVTAPGGYPLDWMPQLLRLAGVALPCDTERDGAAAVDRIARAGMDHVKIAVMHQTYAERPIPAVEPKVVRAVVAEAHRLELRVLAHAHSAIDYRVAVEAGVDALMHSCFDPLSPEILERIADRGIQVCPTLWVFDSACNNHEHRHDRDPDLLAAVEEPIRGSWRRFAEAYAASGDVVPPGIAGGLPKQRSFEAVRNAAANLKLLAEAGVPIAFGNDANYGFSVVSRPMNELRTMHRAGLDGVACLRAATSTAAALLGRKDRGRLAPGTRADLLAIAGDPRDDLEALVRPLAIWANGHPVLAPPSRLGLAGALARGYAGTILESLPRLAATLRAG